jgi:hypothetical protein
MTREISVECTASRYWCPEKISSNVIDEGSGINGTLIDISTKTAENGKLIPIGIVLLDDDGTICGVPMEFIKTNEN